MLVIGPDSGASPTCKLPRSRAREGVPSRGAHAELGRSQATVRAGRRRRRRRRGRSAAQ